MTAATTTDWQPAVAPAEVARVACIGAGVIGGGWVAYFLARGYDVIAWDPAAASESRLRQLVADAWPALVSLGLTDGASLERLRFAASLEVAVADVGFVQESASERLDLKRDLLHQLDLATPPGVVVASSTSGFTMTEMQPTTGGERLVVGHPFNPPYLIPLVEVVGGADTAGAAVDWAAAFYQHAGKTVLRMERELPGFVGNRLQEALWREALHMVASGEATVEEIDMAIAAGPGLRWAIMGPCLTFHLAGGNGGMGHMLDHFGPCLEAPWTRLQAPDLTAELRARMINGCDQAADGRTIGELTRGRDRGLVAILKALNGAEP